MLAERQPSAILEQVDSTAEIASAVEYSPKLSREMVRYIDKLIKREELPNALDDSERFPQIAPKVRAFFHSLIDSNTLYDTNELKALTLVLLSTSSPQKQLAVLEESGHYIEQHQSQEARADLANYLRFTILSTKDAVHYSHYSRDFYVSLTPNERKIYQTEIDSLIDSLDQPWLSHCALSMISQFTPEERLKYHNKAVKLAAQSDPDLNETIDEDDKDYAAYFKYLTPELRSNEYKARIDTFIGKREQNQEWDELLNFYSELTSDELSSYAVNIDRAINNAQISNYYTRVAVLKLAARLQPAHRTLHGETINEAIGRFRIKQQDNDLLEYYENITPEERAKDKALIDEIVNKIHRDPNSKYQHSLLSFLQSITQEERHYFQEIVDQQCQELRENLDTGGNGWRLFDFYIHVTPKERELYQADIAALQPLIDTDPAYYFKYYGAQTPEKRAFIHKGRDLVSPLLSRLTTELGDLGLRFHYLKLAEEYFKRPDSSYIAIDKLYRSRERLGLVLAMEKLGVDPLSILSWELDNNQTLELSYRLQRLTTSQKNNGLLKGLVLPFRPRDNQVAGFEQAVIGWFSH